MFSVSGTPRDPSRIRPPSSPGRFRLPGTRPKLARFEANLSDLGSGCVVLIDIDENAETRTMFSDETRGPTSQTCRRSAFAVPPEGRLDPGGALPEDPDQRQLDLPL